MTAGMDCDYIFKLIVIGDSGVGKSSLTVRLSEDVYYRDYASTIAIDFRTHQITVGGKRIRLQIWDTAGQERFQSVASSFYRGANGVMLCFDLTHRPSFLHLPQWLERVQQQALPGVRCMLIGCKSDEARSSRQVSNEEAMVWARQHDMLYMETSAKERENVSDAFVVITSSILDDMKKQIPGKNSGTSGDTRGLGNTEPRSSRRCC